MPPMPISAVLVGTFFVPTVGELPIPMARPLPDDWLSFSAPLFEWEHVRELVRCSEGCGKTVCCPGLTVMVGNPMQFASRQFGKLVTCAISDARPLPSPLRTGPYCDR
jgi:hypothetical protein